VQHAPTRPVPAHAPAAAHHRAGRGERVEHAVVRALNAVRRRHGLAPLRVAGGLSRVAEEHARDLATRHALSHAGSDGTTAADRIRRIVDARSVGETLIELRGRSTGAAIVRAWMASPTHRVAVLTPEFGLVGVGRVRIRGTSVITADFASSP